MAKFTITFDRTIYVTGRVYVEAKDAAEAEEEFARWMKQMGGSTYNASIIDYGEIEKQVQDTVAHFPQEDEIEIIHEPKI